MSEPARIDLNGNPLPPFALARLGRPSGGRPTAPAQTFSLAFIGDGSRVLAGCANCEVYELELGTGKVLRTLRTALSGGVKCNLALSQDDQTLAVVANDKLELIDVASGRLKSSTRFYDWRVAFAGACAVVAKEKQLLSFADGGGSSDLLATDAYIQAFALTPDAKRIILGTDDGVRIHRDGECIHRSPGQTFTVAISQDGKTAAWIAERDLLVLFDVESGKELARKQLELTRVIAFSPDGQLLASAGAKVQLHDARSAIEVATLASGQGSQPATELTFSRDGKRLGLAGTNALRVWDVEARKELEPRPVGHTARVTAVAAGPNGLLASGDADGALLLWDPQKPTEPRRLGQCGILLGLMFSPDGSRLYGCASGHWVMEWEVATGNVRNLRQGGAPAYPSDRMALSPDGKELAFSMGGGQPVLIYELPSGKERVALEKPGEVTAVGFSPDSKRLITGGGYNDGAVRIWDASSGKLLQTLKKHREFVMFVGFTDEKTLVSGAREGELIVWDAEAGTLIETIQKDRGNRRFFLGDFYALSADGKTVAAQASDTRMASIEIEGGGKKGVRFLRGHHGTPVLCAAFSRDDKHLFTGGEDGTVVQWERGARAAAGSEATPIRRFEMDGKFVELHLEGVTVVSSRGNSGEKPKTKREELYFAEEAQAEIDRQVYDLTGQGFREVSADPITVALFGAVERGDADEVRALVEKAKASKADLQVRKDGMTLLHFAANKGQLESVKALLDGGIPVDIAATEPCRGETALFYAVAAKAEPVVQLLLERGASLKAQNANGRTLLHAAASAGNLGLMEKCLQAGVSIEARDSFGYTPLHAAITEAVPFLLERGANPLAEAEEQRQPIEYAVEESIPALLAAMKAKGPLPKDALTRRLQKDLASLSVANLKLLLDAGAEPGSDPRTLRDAIASFEDPVERTQLMLDHGADPNARDNGYAALDVLAVESSEEHAPALLELLLARGARLDAADEKGWTALHRAAAAGRVDTVKLLLAKGADPKLETKGVPDYDVAFPDGMPKLPKRATARALAEKLELSKVVEAFGATAAAPSGPRHFECTEDGSNKFWEIAIEGSSYTVHYGKVGAKGQIKTKACESEGAARKAADKLIQEKLAKGYRELGGSAPGVEELEFPDQTTAYLVAGREVGASGLSFGQAKAALAMVQGWKAKLPTLVAVAGTDLSETRAAQADSDPIHAPLIVGVEVAQVTADDGPSGAISLVQMRKGVDAAKKLPQALWDELAKAAGQAGDEMALHLISTGPLCAGALVFGAVMSRDDAEEAGYEFEYGQDMTQESHAQVIAGSKVGFVGFDGTESLVIDLSDEAHQAHVDATKKVTGKKAYHLYARYD